MSSTATFFVAVGLGSVLTSCTCDAQRARERRYDVVPTHRPLLGESRRAQRRGHARIVAKSLKRGCQTGRVGIHDQAGMLVLDKKRRFAGVAARNHRLPAAKGLDGDVTIVLADRNERDRKRIGAEVGYLAMRAL